MEISKKENDGAREKWIPGRQKNKYPLHLGEIRTDYLKRPCMQMSEILFQFIILKSYYYLWGLDK